MHKDSPDNLTATLVLGLTLGAGSTVSKQLARLQNGACRRARDSPARLGPLRDLVARGPNRSVCSRAVVNPATL